MMTLDIVTPEKRILAETEVNFVGVTTVDGEIGVLPKHSALYSQLKQGELKYRKNDQDYFVAIHGGFIEVFNDTVTILADDAVMAEDINEMLVEEARQRAQDAMANKVSDEEFAVAEASMRKALLELKVARKKSRI